MDASPDISAESALQLPKASPEKGKALQLPKASPQKGKASKSAADEVMRLAAEAKKRRQASAEEGGAAVAPPSKTHAAGKRPSQPKVVVHIPEAPKLPAAPHIATAEELAAGAESVSAEKPMQPLVLRKRIHEKGAKTAAMWAVRKAA